MRKPGTLGSKKFGFNNIFINFLAELDHSKISLPPLRILKREIMFKKSEKYMPNGGTTRTPPTHPFKTT